MVNLPPQHLFLFEWKAEVNAKFKICLHRSRFPSNYSIISILFTRCRFHLLFSVVYISGPFFIQLVLSCCYLNSGCISLAFPSGYTSPTCSTSLEFIDPGSCRGCPTIQNSVKKETGLSFKSKKSKRFATKSNCCTASLY